METQGRLIVDLSRLKEGGELFEGETSAEILDLEDKEELVQPAGGIAYKLQVESLGNELLVRGELRQNFICVCSFCNETFNLEVKEGRFVESYEINDEFAFLDLTNEIREVIILDLPAHPRCSEACLGLCPECGANLNKGGCECKTDHGDDRWSALNILD
ncbi:MAG: DUF177 domain-containing protein [Kiritimatiellae bacterium]|nr:DUF177 domain-containing protein [Kiritimatiellia bacterium]